MSALFKNRDAPDVAKEGRAQADLSGVSPFKGFNPIFSVPLSPLELFYEDQKSYLYESKSLEILNVTNANLLENYRLIVQGGLRVPMTRRDMLAGA
jgi:hypothetical protein